MDNLFLQSSNALTKAGNEQQKISQKEFEIKLVDINASYSTSIDSNSYFYNQQRKILLESEISSYKTLRDNYINTALLYALTLGEQEILSKDTFSRASIALASINSFLIIQNIHPSLSFPVMVKITSLNTTLLSYSNQHLSLRQALINLKIFLGI